MKKNILVLALLSAIATPALADNTGTFYGAFDVGQSKIKGACNGLLAGWSCKDTASAIRIAAGYQITPVWGIEASYSEYGAAKFSGPLLTATINSETKLNGFAIHAIGTLPVNDAFSLFGKLGIASTSAKASGTSSNPAVVSIVSAETSNTNASFGIGAQYAITNKVALRAQYDDFGSVGNSNTGKSKVTLISAGVVFWF